MWSLIGGQAFRVRAYVSSGVHRPVPQMVELARAVSAMGFAALKVRFGRPELADDLAVFGHPRHVGDALS